jgi:hypothetical protein
VTLVALCFVTVLGITLAGYMAVCSRSMQLSNRTYQARTSQQLAEMGIDEAMRAFNKNDFNTWTNSGLTVTWDTTTYAASKRAVATISYPAGKFGQGVTGSVKIRVDNFDANQLDATWNSTANYQPDDLVGRSGIWYRCVRSNTNQAPNGLVNMAYWVPAPVPSMWSANINYKAEDVVYYTTANSWYRCVLAPTSNQVPTNSTYWTPITKISIDNGYSSINGEVLNFFGTWYYYNSSALPNWFAMPGSYAPVVSWCWRSGYSYTFNDLVGYGYPVVWYRCIAPHTSSGSILPTNPTYWENVLTGSMNVWSSVGIKYNLGDAVYYSGANQWYRCIRAHTSSFSITPSNTAYWSNAPLYSTAWDSSMQYSQNDTVRYNGVWYRSLLNSNTGQNPITATTYWIGANTATTSYQWSATTAYSAGDYRCYGGAWYKCTTAHTGHSPNDTAYWTSTWANSFAVTTGAPVVYAEGTIAIANNPSVRTQLRATIAPAPLFPNAAAATSTLTVSGAGTVDSYDSITDPSASTRGYSAVLAAGNTASTAVTLTGAVTVSGYVSAPSASTPSPYAPLFSYGTSAVVKGTSATPSPKVDVSRVSRSPSIPQFDTLPAGGLAAAFGAANFPSGLPLAITTATTNIGTPGATTPSRYFYNGDLTIGSASVTTLNINGPVILYINGDLNVAGTTLGIINITSTGSAEIHVRDSLMVDQASAGIDNLTLDPKKLIIICDTAASAVQYYGDGGYPFYGVIYAPNTSNSLGLNFNNTASPSAATCAVYGAVSAKKITYDNDANLHYDTSLRYATFGGVDQPYTVTDWRELPVDEQATMP